MPVNTAKYTLLTTWQGGMASRTCCQSGTSDASLSAAPRHIIDSDEPVDLGGAGLAPNPQEMMLAAFNACMMAVFVQQAQQANITLTYLEIQTAGDLITVIPSSQQPDAEGSTGWLQYVIRVRGDGSVQQFEQLHRRVIGTSLNRWLLAWNMTIEGDLILLNGS